MIDLHNRKCTSCEQGKFIETSLHDDWRGVLHCNLCNKETRRYIPIAYWREEQLNKILNELTNDI